MGHYRSEMGFDDEADERRKASTREATAKHIRSVIDAEGIEYVLADIIMDPTMASIRYRKHAP